MTPLGKQTTTKAGWPAIVFADAYGKSCSLQLSSIADYEAVWLGLNDAEPMVLARDAEALGIERTKEYGWVPYPVPPQVLLSTRMHLNREQAEGLIARLQAWLAHGRFTNGEENG